MMVEGFLLGVIVAASLTTALFFLKFWRQTRDVLFLAFAAAFLIEAANRTGRLFADPTDATPWVYVVRLLAFLLLLGAIVYKNRR
jgi:hypothetical protein